MLAKLIVLLIFVAILVALGSGFFSLMRDKGDSNRTVKALSIRVALSIGLFALLYLLWFLGVIEPNSVQ